MRTLRLSIMVQLLCILGFKVVYCVNKITVSPKHGKSVPNMRVVADNLLFTLMSWKGLWFKKGNKQL
jgi:hypothetical protein